MRENRRYKQPAKTVTAEMLVWNRFEKSYFCFCDCAFLFSASSFSVTFCDRFSASARSGFQSLFLIVLVKRSVSIGSLSSAPENRCSASSSVLIVSKASSGQASTHLGSPPQKSHVVALPVSGCIVIPPWSHA